MKRSTKLLFALLIITMAASFLITVGQLSPDNILGQRGSEKNTEDKNNDNAQETMGFLSTQLLVNRGNPLSKDYVPSDLVEVSGIRFAPGTLAERKKMRSEAAEAIVKLFKAAEKDGVRLYGLSGYRSYESQNTIYKNMVKTNGKAHADKYVAVPGKSEHQTGLAMDVTNSMGAENTLSEDFEDTREGIWLRNNAYRFGFIIRYPKGKEKITGYAYEPWHIRYVELKAARDIQIKGITLEEYLKMSI